jgi:polyisoprenyl-teichoic acid--peptidoglycan teichoic acid transferase
MTVRPRAPDSTLAAFLSFIFPGLGQAYMGQRRTAILLAAPVLLLAVLVLAAALLFERETRNALFSSAVLSLALMLDVILMAWRLVAIGQVGLAGQAAGPAKAAREERRGLVRRVVVALLLVATVGMHGWAGVVISRLDSALEDVFVGGVPLASGAPPGPAGPVDPGPLNRPEYRWDGSERVNFLLLGIDAGVGREESLTDTILVVSVDPVSGTAVMISVPRDTGFVPLADRSVYADGVYPRKINELTTEVERDSGTWCPDLPDPKACSLRTLERAISLYVGIEIQYYATVDLQGFADLIDAVGGVTLCLPGRLVDPDYSGPTWPGRGIVLEAGCHPYDGAEALAYARIRRGWLELPDGTTEQQDDFKRSERQQKVLLELRRNLATADLFFELPGILDAIGATVDSDFPRDKAGDLASLLPLITGPDIERLVLGLPDYVDPPLQPRVNYLLLPRRDELRSAMAELFGEVLFGWYLGSEAAGP